MSPSIARAAAHGGRQGLTLLALWLLAGTDPASAGQPPGSDPTREALQQRLDAFVAAPGLPGATLGVVFADGSTVALAAGMADTLRGRPMPVDGVMLSGSAGKTYFGAVALQLVAEGRLALDRPFSEYFEGAEWIDRLPNGRTATVRHLLSHRSGLVRYELNPAFLEDLLADPLRTWTPEERLAYLFDTAPDFAAGEGWEYSDTNFILVAMLIEEVTGRSAYDEIRARLLDPLGLAATHPTDERRIPGIVQGYAGPRNPFGAFDETVVDGLLAFNPQFEWGGGGFASSALDLARFTHAVHAGGVIPPALVEDFLDGTPAPLGPEARYGLGVMEMALPAGLARGHSGFMPGYRTEAFHFPELGVTLALQMNSTDPGAYVEQPAAVLSDLAEIAGRGGERRPEAELELVTRTEPLGESGSGRCPSPWFR